jgi:hypothetical protein
MFTHGVSHQLSGTARATTAMPTQQTSTMAMPTPLHPTIISAAKACCRTLDINRVRLPLRYFNAHKFNQSMGNPRIVGDILRHDRHSLDEGMAPIGIKNSPSARIAAQPKRTCSKALGR